MKARKKATASPRWKAEFLRRMGTAADATTWWWRSEAASSKHWPDLHRALDALKDARIDLGNERHLAFVLDIENRNADFAAYERSGRWLHDRRDLESLVKLYRVVFVSDARTPSLRSPPVAAFWPHGNGGTFSSTTTAPAGQAES
jgi:hypothetical protein